MAARSAREFAEQSKKKNIPLVAVPTWARWAGGCARRRRFAGWIYPATRIWLRRAAGEHRRQTEPIQTAWPSAQFVCAEKFTDCTLVAVEPARAFSQRELAKASGLDEGFTSRIVRQLEEQRLVSRDSAGR